uniref:very-long-chain 3-oxoacyl-CoA reductase 1-like n=1 Tax=Ciona intestinalis TaxID=7719 RepID=UPI00089DBB11|nr:very-long-chain 3-oxoacyl-CoA reductase 1-like [Ciona intestinalis]|eukprot:XP_002124801.2 very-long-chain 3-oxoacyl-CoA reductase 1-like [Ciona intestinalis]
MIVYSVSAFVGSICISVYLLKMLVSLRKFFLREGYDLAKRYGNGTWAIVTAPTSATGYGFAVQLARSGFNIILIGRDIEMLNKLRDLLILRYGVKVRTVIADFRNAGDIDFYTELLRQIEDLDISIVIHAVGLVALSRKFHQQTAERNRQCMIVNMFSPVLLSQHLIPRLQHRYHRSAIVIIGGENANQPIPGMAISSGAKAFLRQFSVAASCEYEDKIDIMTVQPLAVKKVLGSSNKTKDQSESVFVIDSERFARASLKQLGHERCTSGHWIHMVQSWVYSIFPEELKLGFWTKVLPRQMKNSGNSENKKNGTDSVEEDARKNN